MHPRRIAWFGLWSIAIASWFSAASTPDVRTPNAAPERTTASRDLDRSAAVMQAEVSRLHDRLAPSTVPTRSRDLFHFAAKPVARPAAKPMDAPSPADVARVDAPVAPKPSLQLIGVAEDETPDGAVRTAIVSGLGDLFLVKMGDTISGRYRVEQVSADAVQLTDSTTSTTTTLTLR